MTGGGQFKLDISRIFEGTCDVSHEDLLGAKYPASNEGEIRSVVASVLRGFQTLATPNDFQQKELMIKLMKVLRDQLSSQFNRKTDRMLT